MKQSKQLLSLTAAALLLQGFSAQARSFKRGVSENSFMLKEEMEILTPGSCWFYTWGNTPSSGIADYPSEETMEFIPMCWNANYNADNIRNYCKAHPETKYLLGFNEPNFKSQANMTPQQAADAWPAVQTLADELGLELVGPAVNYSPDGPENDPYKWYAEFVKLVGTDAFDYIAIHNYSGGSGGMKEMIDQFYGLYGKQIWVTEFCSWSGDNITAEAQIASMVEQLEYLETSDKVYRYSWFKAKGSITSNPCYGLIVPKNGYGERELSEQGYVYTYMTDFDETVYHGTDEIVPATEYIKSSGLMLGSTKDGYNPSKIEITKFNSGAYADYQFDIPESKEYTLALRVSGEGEPTRFDPNIGIYSVDEDGKELGVLCEPTTFSLSGDNEKYAAVQFKMNLSAGKQRIRIKDANPYQPSGIRISCLSFDADKAGIDKATADGAQMSCIASGDQFRLAGSRAERATVCDLNGRVLFSGAVENNVIPAAGLPAGLYVVKAYAPTGEAFTMKAVK